MDEMTESWKRCIRCSGEFPAEAFSYHGASQRAGRAVRLSVCSVCLDKVQWPRVLQSAPISQDNMPT